MRGRIVGRVASALVVASMLAGGCSGTGSGGGKSCNELFAHLDAFRKVHQQKVMSGQAESDEELRAYEEERDRLAAEYEAKCGPLGG
jgi:hypothetical protein